MSDKSKKPAALKRGYFIFNVMLAIVIIIILIITVFSLPEFGSATKPTINEVYRRYVEDGLKETGAINIVAAMILDYRAFDTLGEAIVLFTAVSTVIMLMRDTKKNGKKDLNKIIITRNNSIEKIDITEQSIILKFIVKIIAPFIFIFGIFIILNGHLSPGGGFSGGAILGAGLSLIAITFKIESIRKYFNFKKFATTISISLLIYAIVKGYSFFMGANHRETGIPLGTPGNILSGGLILPLNICVGIIVACTIYGIYALFAEGDV